MTNTLHLGLQKVFFFFISDFKTMLQFSNRYSGPKCLRFSGVLERTEHAVVQPIPK